MPSGRCNVSDALAGLLDAVVRLAGLSGVHVIVQPPLVAQLATSMLQAHVSSQPPGRPSAPPRKPPAVLGDCVASTAPPAPHAASAAPLLPDAIDGPAAPLSSASGQATMPPEATGVPPPPLPPPLSHAAPVTGRQGCGGGGSVVLGPRPVRAIEAAVPAMALRRIVSYLLDIVLQCTPHGGQVRHWIGWEGKLDRRGAEHACEGSGRKRMFEQRGEGCLITGGEGALEHRHRVCSSNGETGD